jgi:hypothetical protein
VVETNFWSHVAAIVEAATAATIGARATIISQGSPWEGGVATSAEATAVAPSGAVVVAAMAAAAKVVATAPSLLLLVARR